LCSEKEDKLGNAYARVTSPIPEETILLYTGSGIIGNFGLPLTHIFNVHVVLYII
jgi:hypothetical protein